ncbi:hypothetical protein EFP34_07780 [Lacticaseibacillus paracasei]|nr:hypothetical protein [Lacticaseibacillus paracasei]
MTFRRSCSHLTLTGSVYLDLGRAGQRTAITPRATYMPTSKRSGSRLRPLFAEGYNWRWASFL